MLINRSIVCPTSASAQLSMHYIRTLREMDASWIVLIEILFISIPIVISCVVYKALMKRFIFPWAIVLVLWFHRQFSLLIIWETWSTQHVLLWKIYELSEIQRAYNWRNFLLFGSKWVLFNKFLAISGVSKTYSICNWNRILSCDIGHRRN